METLALRIRRRLAPATLIAAALVMTSDGGRAQTRASSPQDNKAYLRISTKKLSLVWNADEGEAGRGRGEIFVSTSVFWPSRVEGTNPQNKVVGPLNGDVEFPSGVVVESPPGSGNVTVEPGIAVDGQFGKIYDNTADCDVRDFVLIDVLVWEEDSNKTLDEYLNLITQAGKVAAAAGVQGAELAAGTVNALIKALTASADDALGRALDFKVTFPDPCAREFGPMTVSVPLENLAKDLWRSVNAEDENDNAFADFGIEPPDVIGSLELQITGGPLAGKPSNDEEKPKDPLAFRELISVDIGQVDEAVVTGVLEFGSNLPLAPPPITYRLFLDVDNNPATGASPPIAPGAEFEASVSFDVAGELTARLFRFNSVTLLFDEIPDGIYDASLNTDRSKVFVSVALDTLGDPAGPLAAWGAVETGGVFTDVFPPSPAELAPTITLDRSFTGFAPVVVTTVPTHDSIDIASSADICVSFSKSMNRAATEAAFSVAPPLPGTFFWQGHRVCLRPSTPLAPFTLFEATIGSTAADTSGALLDGNDDLVPGDPFVWHFTTASLPLGSRVATGDVQGRFEEGDPIYAAGTSFPPSTPVMVYVVTHARAALTSGGSLVDATTDGPTPAVTGADGSLPLTLLGAIAEEGEFNIVVDVDGDGTFARTIDRIDATGIGLFVLPRPVGCDIDGNGAVNRLDINAILAVLGTSATPGDARDANGDGRITIADARACTLKCTQPRCEP